MSPFKASETRPSISIIIPTKNRSPYLKRCLDSLLKQVFTNFETIVVDNDSQDDTLKILQSYPVRIVQDGTRNLPHLFNIGCLKARGDILAFINDDAEATPDWLYRIATVLSEFPDVAGVGGPTIATRDQEIFKVVTKGRSSKLLGVAVAIYDAVVCKGELLSVGTYHKHGAFGIGGSLPESVKINSPILVDLLSITNMAVRRSIYFKIGGFDENFYFSFYDSCFLSKARKQGHKLVFDPRTVVYHHVSPSGLTRSPKVLARDTAFGWMRTASPQRVSDVLLLTINIIFYNGFWVYKCISTGDLRYLAGVWGFVEGLRDSLIGFRKAQTPNT